MKTTLKLKPKSILVYNMRQIVTQINHLLNKKGSGYNAYLLWIIVIADT